MEEWNMDFTEFLIIPTKLQWLLKLKMEIQTADLTNDS